MELERLPGAPGLVVAGFLTAGGVGTPLRLAGLPGLLVLHGEAGEPLGLAWLGEDGAWPGRRGCR